MAAAYAHCCHGAGARGCGKGDLADAAAVDAMISGVNAIVHLGGMSVEGPFGPILQANILGVYNLYEAARRHGVKRVVFASSNHVTGFYRQNETLTADHPARPDGLYVLSKAFGEEPRPERSGCPVPGRRLCRSRTFWQLIKP